MYLPFSRYSFIMRDRRFLNQRERWPLSSASRPFCSATLAVAGRHLQLTKSLSLIARFLKNILKHLESIDQLQRRTQKRYCLLTYCHTKSILCSIGGMKAAMAKMGRPKLPNTKKKVLSIRVSDQLYAQLLAYAEKHKMTTTDVVLRGVETFISRQD